MTAQRPAATSSSNVQTFFADHDAEGVWVYQAFNDDIADFAVANQTLGGPAFNPSRMTWVKPSFGWVLYRSGYGTKPNQNRVLKIKLSHETLARLLSQCKYVDTNKATRGVSAEGGSAGCGRVQWDPERDMLSCEGREPRRMLRRRAIQIGLAGKLSEFYAASILRIVDVTDLARRVGEAHACKPKAFEAKMGALEQELPEETPYLPRMSEEQLSALGMADGVVADTIAGLGLGKSHP